MQKFIIALALVVGVLGASGVHADPVALDCKFKFLSAVEYKDGEYSKQSDNENFSFTIIVDLDTKKAYMSGNAGAASLVMLMDDSQINFIQPPGNSSVKFNTFTTVLLKPNKENKFPAIHSRHNDFAGQSFYASQYYGYCGGF